MILNVLRNEMEETTGLRRRKLRSSRCIGTAGSYCTRVKAIKLDEEFQQEQQQRSTCGTSRQERSD